MSTPPRLTSKARRVPVGHAAGRNHGQPTTERLHAGDQSQGRVADAELVVELAEHRPDDGRAERDEGERGKEGDHRPAGIAKSGQAHWTHPPGAVITPGRLIAEGKSEELLVVSVFEAIRDGAAERAHLERQALVSILTFDRQGTVAESSQFRRLPGESNLPPGSMTGGFPPSRE